MHVMLMDTTFYRNMVKGDKAEQNLVRGFLETVPWQTETRWERRRNKSSLMLIQL